MTITIIIIFTVLIGLIIFLVKSAESEFKKNDVKSGKNLPEQSSEPIEIQINNQRNETSVKEERIEPLKSSILEGMHYIVSNPQTMDSVSQKPHQFSELSQDVVNSVKSQVSDMKEFTSAYEMSLMMDDPNVDMSKVARRISSDPVLSSKILKAANSAYFGSRMAIDSISHALAILGLINIKSILFYNMLYRQSFHEQERGNPAYRSLWNHAVLTARCAVYLADAFEGLNKGRLYTLGLLHDFGRFFMPRMIREKQVGRDFMLPFGDKESIAGEEQLLGINHAVIGRIAFEGCGLSDQMLRLIEIHHFPSFYARGYLSMKEEDKKYLTALYLANQIAKLFADESEKKYYAVQPLPISYQDFVNLKRMKDTFSDDRVLSEIMKTKTLTESYIIS